MVLDIFILTTLFVISFGFVSQNKVSRKYKYWHLQYLAVGHNYLLNGLIKEVMKCDSCYEFAGQKWSTNKVFKTTSSMVTE